MVQPASADGSKPPPPTPPNGQPQMAANPAQPEMDAASQAHAEEIRRRIEERRRQLREEAERMRSEQTN